jgi:hypothetical protein
MNAALLAQLAREAREQMIGSYLGAPCWYPPVLAISYARERYLVAVLETPGPFCFLAHLPGRMKRPYKRRICQGRQGIA